AAMYGDHPYGWTVDGTPDSLNAITRENIIQAHDIEMTARGAVVTAVGSFEPDVLVHRLQDMLPQCDQEHQNNASIPAAWPAPTSIELTKQCEQAFLCKAFHTVPISHPDYPAL